MDVLPFLSTVDGPQRMLSNFWAVPLFLLGVWFSGGVEQAYVWVKARLLIRDPARFQAFERRIFGTTRPAEWKSISKAVGNSVGARELAKWDDVKSALMLSLVWRKFHQNSELSDFLLSTQNQWLVEANPSDSFWGAGIGVREIEERVRRHGARNLKFPGGNILGGILMSIRSFLAGEGVVQQYLVLGDSILKGIDFSDASVLVWPGATLKMIELLADIAYIPGGYRYVVIHAGTNDVADIGAGGTGLGRSYLPRGVTPQVVSSTLLPRYSSLLNTFLSYKNAGPRVIYFSEILFRPCNDHPQAQHQNRVNQAVELVNLALAQLVGNLETIVQCVDHSWSWEKHPQDFKTDGLHLSRTGSSVLSETLRRETGVNCRPR